MNNAASHHVIRVVLCDDHVVVLEGLGRLVDTFPNVRVVGTARNGTEVIDVVQREDPDIVLMDLQMPGADGVTATKNIRSLSPRTAVVVLTSFSDRPRIEAALQAGAVGYLLKDATPSELESAIRAAAQGDAPLAPKVARVLVSAAEPQVQLSSREMRVLELVAAGQSNKQIARSLGIAEATVKAHLTSIFRATQTQNRTQAARWLGTHQPLDGGWEGASQ